MPALSCFNLAKGIDSKCDLSIGGVKEVILLDFDVLPVTETTSGETEVTGFTTATSGNTYGFTFKKNTASMVSDLQTGDSNYVQTQITMQFSKMDGKKRVAMNALLMAETRAVVADNNGLYWLVGNTNEVSAVTAQGTSGTNRSDSNNYNIVLQGEEIEFPIPVTPSAWNAIKEVAQY